MTCVRRALFGLSRGNSVVAVAAAMVLCCVGHARGAALVVGYNVASNPEGALAASETGAGVTALPLSRGTGIIKGNTESYDGTQFTTADDADPNDYFQWGWSASAPVDLTTLDIGYRRANTNGPRVLRIDVSVNGGAYQTVHSDAAIASTPVPTGEANLGIDLSSLDGVTSATFRLFAWDAPGSSGAQLEIKNYTSVAPLRGLAVFAVPEPSAAVLFVLACSAIGMLRKRGS
jgi:hypothetical protein